MEIDRLTEAGVLRPTISSDWAAPVVPVLKADGSVHQVLWQLQSDGESSKQGGSLPFTKREGHIVQVKGCKVFQQDRFVASISAADSSWEHSKSSGH